MGRSGCQAEEFEIVGQAAKYAGSYPATATLLSIEPNGYAGSNPSDFPEASTAQAMVA